MAYYYEGGDLRAAGVEAAARASSSISADAARRKLRQWLVQMGQDIVSPCDIKAVDFEDWRVLESHGIDPATGKPITSTFDIPSGYRTEFADAFIAYAETNNMPGMARRLRAQLQAHARPKPKTETAQVSTTPDKKLSDSAKDFGVNVAYRTAALQLTKRTRGLLADALTQHLKGKARASKRQVVLDLLDGPMGGPLVAVLLSGVLPQAAGLIGQNGAKMDRLAEELRLHAGVSVASDLVDGLFGLLGPAREVLTQALSGLPDVAPLQEGSRGGVVLDLDRAGAAVRG